MSAEPVDRQSLLAVLTGPGGPFEVEQVEIGGLRLPAYKTAPPSMRQVYETAIAFGDRPFLVYEDTRWSYAETDTRVRRLARHLVDVDGVSPGDRVAIGMRNFPEWVVSFWATQVIGAVAVPLNAWWTGEELQYAVEHSGAVVALLDDERWARLAPVIGDGVRSVLVARSRTPVVAPAVAMDDVLEADGPPPELPAVEIASDDPAAIMYTSGTTGRPKGAVQTHRNHCTNLMNTALIGALGAAGAPTATTPPVQQVSLQTFPFFHIGGLSGLYISTAFGSTIVMMYRWDAAEAVRLVVEEHVTALAGVPTVVRQLFDELDRQAIVAESLGTVSSGGAPVPPHLIDRIGERSGRGIRPGNGYGLTETTSAVVINAGDEYYDHPDSVGRPVPVAAVSIRDELGAEVPTGTTGELWVRGANVVAGYWNDPAATATSFTDGWFHTGDAAYVDDGGLVYVVDRLKDVVIRGGENVYCAEVEAVLHAMPGVLDVAVIGTPHDVLGEEVAAVVELEPGATVTAAELRQAVADHLAAFKVPTRIHVSAEPLPRTATGKVLKRDLRNAVGELPVLP